MGMMVNVGLLTLQRPNWDQARNGNKMYRRHFWTVTRPEELAQAVPYVRLFKWRETSWAPRRLFSHYIFPAGDWSAY